MKYLVASTFEGGYQPLNAISATTALLDADIEAQLIDIYVEGLALERFSDADLVFICVPLFDSLTAGTQLAKQLKEAKPSQKICFFGQYATINAKSLASKYGDYAIAGEWEKPIVSLAKHLSGEQGQDLRGVIDRTRGLSSEIVVPQLIRDGFRLPRRDLAPPLHKYPQPQLEKLLGEKKVVGGVEGSRGCHHKCSYCSVYAAYDGKVLLVSDDLVERDVTNLVAQGMTHLTFTDADFFNAKKHGLKIIRTLHSQFPDLTYDFTTRVDHILENKDAIKEMGQLGLAFITTALEFPKQEVLDQVFKEMNVPMIEEALAFLKEAGVKVNPTFITFNPWVSLEDMAELHDFIARNELENIVDPIQFETRLHLYKGLPLFNNDTVKELQLEEHEFHFDWQHADSRLDKLFMDSVTPPEEGVFKRCCLKC